MEEDEPLSPDPLPPGWDPLGLADKPLDPDDTVGPGGGTGFGESLPQSFEGLTDEELTALLALYPDTSAVDPSADPHSGPRLQGFEGFEGLTDKELTALLALSPDTSAVDPSALNPSIPEVIALSPDTSALGPAAALNPSKPQVTAKSVFDKLTQKEANGEYLLTELTHNNLRESIGLAAVDEPRSRENLDNLRTQLDNLTPEELKELNKKINSRISARKYVTSKKGRATRAAYLESPTGREVRAKYTDSELGKKTQAEAVRRYRANKKEKLGGLRSASGSVTPNDGVVDGGVGKPLRVVPVTALMAPIFVAAAVIAAVLADLNGWGGSESEKKLRAGAAGLGDGGEQSGSVTARQGGWVGRAAEAYDSDSATLAGLSAVMADTDTATAALLQAHDERLEITRTVIDSTDALLTVSDPIAVALEALPATGLALSIAFQLSVAIPALHACYSAEQHALHSSARTAAALQDAAATYDYIHTTATQLI